MTPLDAAHAAMEAAPEDDAARLAFYGLFAGTELFLMLAEDSEGDDAITPSLFEVEGARFVVAFDREERLTGFTGTITPYAALPGRALAAMMAGQGIGIAFNADLPSAVLIPAEAVDWLALTLSGAPEQAEARPTGFHPAEGVPDRLFAALDARLAAAAGLARAAWLTGVSYEGGARGHLLAFAGTRPGAEPALAAAVNEALTFSGVAAGWLDVTFLAADDPALDRIARSGLRFDLPDPVDLSRRAPGAEPGMDPARPPRLR